MGLDYFHPAKSKILTAFALFSPKVLIEIVSSSKVPQEDTISEVLTPANTGYSKLPSAKSFCASGLAKNSTNFIAFALFGAYLATPAPDTFICVPPFSNFGKNYFNFFTAFACDSSLLSTIFPI